MSERWTFQIHDTNSGAFMKEVFPTTGNWRTTFTGIGEGRHTFHLRDPDRALPRKLWQSLATQWKCTLVVLWDGIPVYSGVVLTWKWDKFAGVLTLSHSEAAIFLAVRHLFGLSQYEVGTVTITGKSLRAAVRAIIFECMGPKSSRWVIPIVYPADEAGTFSKTYFNYEFQLGEKVVREIQARENGPDWFLHPQLKADGSLEYELRIGNPRLSGGRFRWEVDAEESGLTKMTVESDAKKQLTGAMTIGKGSGEDTPWGRAPEPIDGYTGPYLDVSLPYSTELDPAVLSAFARAALAARQKPTKQYEMTLLASAYPGADKLVPGSSAVLAFDGDEFLDEETVTTQIMALAGDMGFDLKPELQEV